jgi:hypothetical protein
MAKSLAVFAAQVAQYHLLLLLLLLLALDAAALGVRF